ncbi:MAG: transketolase C-terminal domain-containing protein [bacterium]|nr:transketolase C-terminal domain-containing protein [bacterium]
MELLSTRQAFGEALYEIMKKDERIFALTADLGESLKMGKIMEEFPDRFIDTGVAEANMAGVAAGLALGGYIPVAGSFAVFLTRAFDHIRLQICQNPTSLKLPSSAQGYGRAQRGAGPEDSSSSFSSGLHVIIVGSHGGVSNAPDGGSAHALEDIAYMRALPNMTIINPSDYNEAKKALVVAINYPGPVYLRLYREPTAQVTKTDAEFVIGKANVLKEGKDVSIVATGPQVAEVLVAVANLAKENIDAEVIAVPTIKPLDEMTLLISARKTGRVVTVEDHSVNGGLGSAVAEVMAENNVGKLRRLGLRQFGESGSYQDLIKKVGIDSETIAQAVRDLVKI